MNEILGRKNKEITALIIIQNYGITEDEIFVQATVSRGKGGPNILCKQVVRSGICGDHNNAKNDLAFLPIRRPFQ
jgi:hypothetical protein